MRVIQLGAHGGFGGGERVLRTLATAGSAKVDHTVLTPEGPFFDDQNIHHVALKGRFPVWQIRRVIQRLQPDVLHCHGTRAAFWGRLAVVGIKQRPRVVYTLHGFHIEKRSRIFRKPLLLLERLLNWWVDDLVCVSQADRSRVFATGVFLSRVHTIPNGVNISDFQTDAQTRCAVRKRLGVEGKTVFIAVARLHPPKDHATILRAFQHVVKTGEPVHLLIVGDGPLRANLEELTERLGIGQDVSFLGFRDDVPALLSAADVSLLSTHWEGLPLAPLEAGAARRPVIASDVTGVRETVEHKKTGLLFPDGDQDALAACMQTLINHPETRRQMGKAGFEYVQASFSQAHMISAYETLYQKKRVLQIVKLYDPVIGGVETIAKQIAEGIASNACESRVLCCAKKGKGGKEMRNSVHVNRAGSFGTKWGMPLSLAFFLEWLRERRADVVNVHLPFPLADIALWLFPPRGRLIVHYHSDIVRQRAVMWLFRPFIRHTLRKAERIVISSPHLRNSSPALANFQEKTVVVPFGVNLSEQRAVNLQQVAQLKEQYGSFVLYVGRFGYYKGLSYLIRAMRDVPATLLLVGDGPEKHRLEKEALEYGVKNNVVFLPFQSEARKRALLRAARVFVLPSIFRSEAFGIVLMEALAQGTPCISTELGTGTSWVNVDGETGFVVPPKDTHALREALRTLISSDNTHARFQKNARQRAEEVFNERSMLAKIKKLYTMDA